VAGLSTSIKLIWLASGILQFAILVLVVVRHNYRAVPTFTWYIGLNLSQAFIMLGVYSHFGFVSDQAFHTYWAIEVIVMILQTLASTELLHRALQDYSGVWELTWRIILAAIFLVIVYAWATANSKDEWGLFAVHRGYHLTFALAFVLCLLLIRRYGISVDPVYKMLVAGFCFYSCGTVFADTLLKSEYLKRFKAYSELWNSWELWLFVIVLVVWAIALRNPVRVRAQTPALIGTGTYEIAAPALNSELRAINDSLRKFFDKGAAKP
jgi:hypothetical protein